MRTFALSLALITTALPALAGGFTFELPNLTWPSTVTVSTQDCAPSVPPCK